MLGKLKHWLSDPYGTPKETPKETPETPKETAREEVEVQQVAVQESEPEVIEFEPEISDNFDAGALVSEEVSQSPVKTLREAPVISEDDLKGLMHSGKTIQRRIVHLEEVPFDYKVKVPVIAQRIISDTKVIQVKTRRAVEYEDFEEVEEKYTVMEEVERTREKKVWVQTTVHEEYTEKVPIVKTRIVRKPITRIKEVEAFKDVVLPTSKIVNVQGYRVDEITDRKIVEVDEYEEYQLVPTGRVSKGSSREEITPGRELARVVGTEVFLEGEDAINGLPQEDGPPSADVYVLSGKKRRRSFEDEGEYTQVEVQDKQATHDIASLRSPTVKLTELNAPEEHFTVTNLSDAEVDMDGWFVHDSQVHQGQAKRNVFSFADKAPGLVLGPGESTTVYCGEKSSTAREYDKKSTVHWFNWRVWDDDGDKAFLVDPSGHVVHTLWSSAEVANAAEEPVEEYPNYRATAHVLKLLKKASKRRRTA